MGSRDADRVRELERLVEDLKAELANTQTERARSVASLAAMIGHGLRNPLAAVLNAHYYLTMRLGSLGVVDREPKVKEFLGFMESELHVSIGVIRDLLEFARAEPLVRSACTIGDITHRSLARVTVPPSVRVDVQIAEDVPMVAWDPEMMERALVNLIENAVEAVPFGRAGHVVVRVSCSNERVRIEVEDNGVGIEPHDVTRIFEPLYTTRAKGTGLGLAVVETIIRRHDGSVSCTSVVGRGSRFVVVLPVDVE
jgi:signal transduction histidine kinase